MRQLILLTRQITQYRDNVPSEGFKLEVKDGKVGVAFWRKPEHLCALSRVGSPFGNGALGLFNSLVFKQQ